MKSVAIVGLGWLGMPLALAMAARGWQVAGTKTTADGVEAARMCGIESYRLQLTPELQCDSDDLDALLSVDALVVTLPARRSGSAPDFYLHAVQQVVDSALARGIARIVFTSSTSVYGVQAAKVTEETALAPQTDSARILCELEQWLHSLPGTRVDILRLAGLVGPQRHPGHFFAGKTIPQPQEVVNLVHQEDAVNAIIRVLEVGEGGQCYNLAAPGHPARGEFYPLMARKLGLEAPQLGTHPHSASGKEVDGSRICTDLGFEYQYPDPMTMPLD